MSIARRTRLAEADTRLSNHLAEAARHWWGIGEVCSEVERDALFQDGNHADVYAWALERHGMSRRSVERAMEVARHFSAEMAQRYGSEKLVSTVAYLETTKKIEKAGDAVALRFRVRRDGVFKSITFEKATSRDIDEARALVLKTRQEKPPAPDPVAVTRARVLNAALASLPKVAGKGDRVTVLRAADGTDRLTFHEIPIGELEAFARAVLGGNA